MKADAVAADDFVVLSDMPKETYDGLLAALPQQRDRLSYRGGNLRLPTVMHHVAWDAYEEVLNALGDHSLRHIYDSGTLEIMMSPLEEHEWLKRYLGRMIETLSLLLDIPIKCVGSTTHRRKAIRKGAEPDEGYYIANEPKVRGRRKRDPNLDPPLDLAVEVDITSTSLKRMKIYAAMRVPEVWRHDGTTLFFYRLNKRGQYVEVEKSRSFPFLSSADMMRYLNQLDELDENTVMKRFVAFARRRIRAYRQTGGSIPGE
jgi:Uma2 family endonuclease